MLYNCRKCDCTHVSESKLGKAHMEEYGQYYCKKCMCWHSLKNRRGCVHTKHGVIKKRVKERGKSVVISGVYKPEYGWRQLTEERIKIKRLVITSKIPVTLDFKTTSGYILGEGVPCEGTLDIPMDFDGDILGVVTTGDVQIKLQGERRPKDVEKEYPVLADGEKPPKPKTTPKKKPKIGKSTKPTPPDPPEVFEDVEPKPMAKRIEIPKGQLTVKKKDRKDWLS